MKKSELTEFLLKNAGPSIRYRVKKEILGIPTDSEEMISLQAEILALPKIKKAFASQGEDGFIGRIIHGVYFDGFDSTLELLKRYGVELTNPNMQRAKECLLNWTNFEQDSFFKAGNAMDEHGRGGFRAIWADLLVELGADEFEPRIQEQINNALAAFRGALNYSCTDDFSKKATFKGVPCRYYIKGAEFPAANHIKMLEKTTSWRNEENLTLVRKSFLHCREIMRGYSDGVIYVNCGYFVGPFNYNWNVTSPESVRDFDENPIDFAWFLRGLSTASVKYPLFDNGKSGACKFLESAVSDDFISAISDEQKRVFKKYASIEQAWRKEESVACDIYFPILLEMNRVGL